MIYHVTYNAQRQKIASRVNNREEFVAIRNSAENLAHLAMARAGDEKAKAKLAQFAYNLGHVEGPLAGCKSIGSYFFHDIDCYNQAESQAMAQQILAKKDEIGLKMLERSANGGYHLVCQRQAGCTILENQVRIASILQMEMDTNTHDLQRVSFSSSGSPDDLIYLDDELFEESMTAEECEAEYARLKERERKGEEQVAPEAKKARKHYKPWEGCDGGCDRGQAPVTHSLGKVCDGCLSPVTAAAPVTERVRFIADGVMREKGLEHSDFLDAGGRHTTVKVFLSGATQLLTKAETNGMLSVLMPDHWNDDNIQQLVTDFYAKYTNPNQKLLKFQEQLFAQSLRLRHFESPQPTQDFDPDAPSSELSRIFASSQPPQLPSVLPKLVKAVTCNTPQKYKGTVAQAMFPPLMSYPRKLSFVYIDNQVRELRANCLIVAETGSGKDSSTKQPLAHIIADMKQRDEENRRRLKEFNDDYNSKAANKQKPQRPADLIIQTIKSDITKAALAQRMDEAQGAPLYVRINELEQWDKIEGSSGRGNQFTTLKLCDDEGNDYGTDRAGTQSVTVSGSLHLNWNANTTIAKAIKYFRYVLTDGPISRLCLGTISEDEIGAEIEVFGTYDEKYDLALKPFIENLKKSSGVIDCREAKRLARKLKDECADFARLSQDRVFDNLSHRALVIAFRKACLLYAANGMKWEKSIESFCRWSLFYDLYIKMTIFGDLIRHADDDMPTSKRGPRSLLDLLPGTFTIDDAKQVRIKLGMDTEKTGNMVSTWKKRHYVVQMADGSFKKASINNSNN